MKIGVRAHDFGGGSFAGFEENIRRIAAAGYQTVQLAPVKCITEIGGLDDLTESHLLEIAAILEKYGIEVGVLGCYVDFSVDSEAALRKSIDTFKAYLSYAKLLKAGIVATETSYGRVADEAREGYLRNITAAMKEIAKAAKAEGVVAAVEPVAEHALNSPELLRKLLDEVNSDCLKALYDPVNLLLPETVLRQEEMFFRVRQQLGNDIVALHIKDFTIRDGKKNMVPLGAGVVSLEGILRFIREEGLDIPIIREDSLRESDQADIAYIRARC